MLVAGIKEARYEYITKINELGEEEPYYAIPPTINASYLKSVGKKSNAEIIKLPKNIKTISLVVVDIAGNASEVYTYEFVVEVPFSLPQGIPEGCKLLAVGDVITELYFDRSEGVTNTIINNINANPPYINFVELTGGWWFVGSVGGDGLEIGTNIPDGDYEYMYNPYVMNWMRIDNLYHTFSSPVTVTSTSFNTFLYGK